jgi:hypothetical protein
MRDLIEQHKALLAGKVVIDPSNPIAVDERGQCSRTLPDEVSAGSVIAGSLPPGTHHVKAFCALGAPLLQQNANRTPERAVVFHATADTQAATAVEELITAAGFTPVKAGGLEAAIRLKAFGDLSARVLELADARAAVDHPGPAGDRA